MHARIYDRGNLVSIRKLKPFNSELWVSEKARSAWWMDTASEVNEIRLPWWGFRPGRLPEKLHRFFRIRFIRSLVLDAADGYPLNLGMGIRKRFRAEPADEGERIATANELAGYLKSSEVENSPGINWNSDTTLGMLLGLGIVIDAILLIIMVIPHVPAYLEGAGS